MADAMKLEDVLFFKLKDLILEQSEGEWTDEMIVRDAHHFANNLRPLLAASPPAREEAPAEEAGLYNQGFSDGIIAQALRASNRTSEPEAGAVGVVCGTAQADMHTADLPVGTKLFTHPAPATADNLRVEALERIVGDYDDYRPNESEFDEGFLQGLNRAALSAEQALAALNEQPQ